MSGTHTHAHANAHTHTPPSGHVNTLRLAYNTHHYCMCSCVCSTLYTLCRLKGPTNNLIVVWLPPLVQINTNTHTVHICTHKSPHCAKWKLRVKASSHTAQLPAMPATLSKPNGHSEQQHCVWRLVHSWAFCGISGTFCLWDYACRSVTESAAMVERRGVVKR